MRQLSIASRSRRATLKKARCRISSACSVGALAGGLAGLFLGAAYPEFAEWARNQSLNGGVPGLTYV
ncbi:MAG: hypothetical protein WC876_10605 [Candidatus Thermoplasmatota archaeon]